MAEVKPAEVSAILRQQLSGFKSEQELEEVGTVLQVGDGIARIYGLSKIQTGLTTAFWIWLGFIMPVQLADEIFGGHKWGLLAINTGYQLTSILVMAVAIAYI